MSEAAYDWIVLSPHPDDAVLSCGGFLLTRPEGRSHVVRVFDCEHEQAGTTLGHHRTEEDLAALASIPVSHSAAGFPEALLRGERPITFRPGRAAAHPNVDELADWMKSRIRVGAESVVIAPMGIGDHVDHLITLNAALDLFTVGWIRRLWLYEDVPYRTINAARSARLRSLGAVAAANWHDGSGSFSFLDPGFRHVFPGKSGASRVFWTARWNLTRWSGLRARTRARAGIGLEALSIDIRPVIERKAEILSIYRSQTPMLFAESKNLAGALVRSGNAKERFWAVSMG